MKMLLMTSLLVPSQSSLLISVSILFFFYVQGGANNQLNRFVFRVNISLLEEEKIGLQSFFSVVRKIFILQIAAIDFFRKPQSPPA